MRVKTLCSVMLGVAGLLASMTAQAQAPEGAPPAAPEETTPPPAAPATSTAMGSRMLLGLDLAFSLPLGDFADGAGIGFGGLARFEYVLMPNLNLTGRLGYIHHLEKNGFNFSMIPILAGVKFGVTEAIYLAAELGLFNNRISGSVFGMDFSDSETDVGATVGAGFRTGDIDIRAGLMFADLGNAGESMALMINAGYNFLKM